MAMMISWVALVNPFIRPWRMTRLRRLTPTICAFHLGFGLGICPRLGWDIFWMVRHEGVA